MVDLSPVKLSEIKQILSERGIKLTKSLGQNFLHDQNQVRRIVDAAQLTSRDKVLEIGAGLGPLTELLVARASQVLAIEKDRNLIQVLQDRIKVPTFELMHGDALAFLEGEARDWSGWKVVSNLPYSVASPILVELARAKPCPELMVATLQLEVAKRLMAKPGEKDYGVLTLLVQIQYEPRNSFKIPATCFFPEPEVESACITLVRRETALLPTGRCEDFSAIVKRSFSQRRKMMFKLLKEDWPAEKLERAFHELRLPPQVRAETVSLEQFVRLTQLLLPDSAHG